MVAAETKQFKQSDALLFCLSVSLSLYAVISFNAVMLKEGEKFTSQLEIMLKKKKQLKKSCQSFRLV